MTGADERLRKLAVVVDDLVADLADWQATLRSLEADGRPVPRHALTRRCVHHAALWQLLVRWLEARDEDASGQAEAEFRAHVAHAPLDAAERNGTPRANGVAVG
jgi:hypothetical protein